MIGLKWTSIDLVNKTISIRHTVIPVYFEGKEHIIEKEWLGHSNYSTTANIYSQLEYSSKVSSASTMSGVLIF